MAVAPYSLDLLYDLLRNWSLSCDGSRWPDWGSALTICSPNNRMERTVKDKVPSTSVGAAGAHAGR